MTTKKAAAPTTAPADNLPATQPLNPLAMFGGTENALSGIDLRLPQIGIIHQPTGLYVLPDGDSVKEISGIILHVMKVNAFWITPFDKSGGGSPPDCFSLNGIQPDFNCQRMQAEYCLKCEQNKFNKETGMKPCKNKKRIHVMFDGALMPYRITAPVTSCANLDIYASTIVSQGLALPAVVTTMSLSESHSKGGIKYMKMVFKKHSEIPREDLMAIRDQLIRWKPIMEGQAFDQAEG